MGHGGGRCSTRLGVVLLVYSTSGLAGPASLPQDADIARAPEQEILARQGLYVDELGNVKSLDGPSVCEGLSTEAHRGSQLARYPENSVGGIVAALMDGHDGVEVDVQRLRDGTWVVHHDPYLGRTVYAGQFSHKPVERSAKRTDWARMVMLDGAGRQTDYRPPTLAEALAVFAEHAHPKQKINIEIKSGASCQHLLELPAIVGRYLTPSQYSYSSLKLKSLECLRPYVPGVLLGYILPPNKRSLDEAYRDRNQRFRDFARQEKGINIDPLAIYRNLARDNRRLLSVRHLQEVHKTLGEPSSINLDIRDLVENPGLARSVRSRGLQLVTYSMNGGPYHNAQLARLAGTPELPDRAIVDSARYATCRAVMHRSAAR